MNREQAKELIRDTFESPFDKGRFVNFIKNLLNTIDYAPFDYYGQYIPDPYKSYINRYERIGKYSDGENRIDILIIYLKRQSSIERARSMQRNFIAGYLKGNYGSSNDKDAALVAFVSPDEEDWRFSLVEMDYRFEERKSGRVKVREEFTPARRWSFLVGKNEKSHTAQSRLVSILEDDEHNPTLKQLEEAFNIEPVTKEFFDKYRDLLIRTVDALDKIVKRDQTVRKDFESKNINTVDFAKKLLGQIVFLYFLQKKGWFGVAQDEKWGEGDRNFLRNLFEKCKKENKDFFNDYLEELFYNTLNNPRIDQADPTWSKYFNCKIPFLNGGLFEPIGGYDWVNTDILLPDDLFSNRRRTPEGDIGDGILDVFDRFNFTVKEDEPLEKEVAIDPELLGKLYEKFNAIRPDNFYEYKKALASGKRSLEKKFNKKFGVYYTPREIVHYMCQQSLIYYLSAELAGKVSKEDIEKLIKYGEQFTENEATALIKERRIKEGKQKTSDYELKLPESIRKNARLIDDKLRDIKICDPAIGSGAFPVGMMHEIVKTRNVLSAFINGPRRSIYNFKRECIENSLYGVDIDAGACEVAKLRLWLSLVVDEEDIRKIKPLPNLDYKIVCGNSLLGFPEDWRSDISERIEILKREYFKETNPNRKRKLKNEIDRNIRWRLENSERNFGYKIDFDFRLFFSEVFHEKGGFDVVIANPPYGANIDEMVKIYRRIYSEVIKNYADIYKIFFAKGLNICRPYGVLTFITSNTFLSQPRYKDLRRFLLTKYKIVSITNLGFEVFEDVDVPVAISIIINSEDKNKFAFCDLSINSKFCGNLQKVNTSYQVRTQSEILKLQDLNMLESYELKENQKRLDEILWVKDAGIQYHRYGIGLKNKGGSDLYDRLFSKKNNRFKNSIPVWYGRLIDSYYIQKETDEFFNLDYKKVLKHNEAVAFSKEAFEQTEKILWRQTASYIRASLDRKKRWFRNTIQCAWIKEEYRKSLNIKYILGLMNSKYLRWLYNKFVNESGRLFPQVKITHVKKLPIPFVSLEKQQPIIKLVDRILSLTQSENYLENPQKQAKVKEYERQIDQLVYKLYGLTEEEIKIVEGE